MKVAGKTFVVTGGGSGMGQELVLLLLDRGGSVAAVDIRQAGLDETVARADAGERLSTHITDIADKAAVRELVAEVLERHGHVDGLFNNAGVIQPFKKIHQLDDTTIERVMNINFFGTLNMTRAFLPHLLERPQAHIVNTSSMGGFLPVPGQAIYGASKAAVKLMTEALYAELLDTNVRVSAVFPGAVATNITENSGVESPVDPEEAPSIKSLPAPDAARKIVDGMEHDDYHVLVGSDAYLMDKLSRLMPEKAVKVIQKQMKALLPDD
jgi:NAD(P)-dependent dehydrogenase (short-subunit alcohol dehydrogenase family)